MNLVLLIGIESSEMLFFEGIESFINFCFFATEKWFSFEENNSEPGLFETGDKNNLF